MKKSESPTVLITGAVSLLGKYLADLLDDSFNLILTTHKTPPVSFISNRRLHFEKLDITKEDQVVDFFEKIKPAVVIHLAAISNIDYCQKYPKEALKVNFIGTKNLCQNLLGRKTHFVFTSSNAVFDGTKAPYGEKDIPNPLNVYGQTKWQAEKLLLHSDINSTVVRFTTMFGWPPKGARDNDVTFYLKKLKQKSPLYLVNDRFFNPIYAATAAFSLKKIIDSKKRGIFHVAGRDSVSRYTFVKKIAQSFGIKNHSQLVPVKNSFFKSLAPRPFDATLAVTKMGTILGIVAKSLSQELVAMKVETQPS